jgi:ribonucleotide reductase beta subunit family protein with ferritin-like domain
VGFSGQRYKRFLGNRRVTQMNLEEDIQTLRKEIPGSMQEVHTIKTATEWFFRAEARSASRGRK